MQESPSSPTRGLRDRILGAAFAAFLEKGYSGVSTREIAARAKISKRDLYALFEDKKAMLAACIEARAQKMRRPLELPTAPDGESLPLILRGYGAAFLRHLSSPEVVALYRLAVLEAQRSPEVAHALNELGRESNRTALADFLKRAQGAGLLGPGEPLAMASQFLSLLWGDLMLRLLLGVARSPKAAEVEERARAATEAVLALHAQDSGKAPMPSGSGRR